MMNYIIWNNKDSRDINGLLICELPPITKPNMRVKETVIDGVDGSIIEELGYESYDKTITVGLKIGADVDEIIEYFTGDGEIVFSNEPDKYYRAKIIKGIDYQRLLRYRTATVTFRVQPFKYDSTDVEMSIAPTSDRIIIDNRGNYTAKPLITIKGEGTVVLSLNGTAVFQYTFPDEEDTVVIDSERQDAYLVSIDNLRNRKMVGAFPVLQKGSNVLTWSGTIERIQIKRYSRWL